MRDEGPKTNNVGLPYPRKSRRQRHVEVHVTLAVLKSRLFLFFQLGKPSDCKHRSVTAQPQHSHSTATAQSRHSHSTVTAQSGQTIGLQAPISIRYGGQVDTITRHARARARARICVCWGEGKAIKMGEESTKHAWEYQACMGKLVPKSCFRLPEHDHATNPHHHHHNHHNQPATTPTTTHHYRHPPHQPHPK